MSAAFVALLLIDLHFPDAASLKAKRSEIAPVRAHLLRQGFAVAEVDHHDRWQRATLAAAVVGRSPRALDERADELQGWLDARFPQGASVRRALSSWDDLVGIA